MEQAARRLEQAIPAFVLCFPGQLEAEFVAVGVHVCMLGPVRLSRWASVARARRELYRLLRGERRPDIVVSHGPWACTAYSLRRSARRGFLLALFLHNPLRVRWLDLLARATRPQLVITNSMFTLSKSRWWTRGMRAVVFVLPPFSAPRDVDREAVRARLGVSRETVLVIFRLAVSSLIRATGFISESLSHLNLGVEWRALFVGAARPGRCRYARSLERLRNRLGLESRVQFLGHRTDAHRDHRRS